MRIIKTKNYEEMSRRAADIMAAQIILKPDCVLGLATGSTPEGLYAQLVRLYRSGDVDFQHVHTVNLDEYRGLRRSDPHSYYYFMHRHLFSNVNIDLKNTHLPDGETEDAQIACQEYEAVVQSLGGIDMQLLGIGRNGHIGFNEPDAAFAPYTHCVRLTDSTIEANARFFESADYVPREAYTMGIGTIMRARRILLTASGESKAEILNKMVYGPVVPSVPASILQFHPNVTIVCDEAAGALLK